MYVIDQAMTVIYEMTGVKSDTAGWDKAANHMLDTMGCRPEEILAALRIALRDPWHKPRVMDKGLPHIRYNYHQLMQAVSQPTSKLRKEINCSEMFRLGKHQRWDVQNHLFIFHYTKDHAGQAPDLKTIQQYADWWMTQNMGVAEDWIDCPVCQEEIAHKLLFGKSAQTQRLAVTGLVKDIPNGRSD